MHTKTRTQTEKQRQALERTQRHMRRNQLREEAAANSSAHRSSAQWADMYEYARKLSNHTNPSLDAFFVYMESIEHVFLRQRTKGNQARVCIQRVLTMLFAIEGVMINARQMDWVKLVGIFTESRMKLSWWKSWIMNVTPLANVIRGIGDDVVRRFVVSTVVSAIEERHWQEHVDMVLLVKVLKQCVNATFVNELRKAKANSSHLNPPLYMLAYLLLSCVRTRSLQHLQRWLVDSVFGAVCKQFFDKGAVSDKDRTAAHGKSSKSSKDRHHHRCPLTPAGPTQSPSWTKSAITERATQSKSSL